MTRQDAKVRALEFWGELGIVAKMAAVVGLLSSLWLLTTAAKGGMESWLMTREDANRLWAQQAAKEALHLVRDSARQERIDRRLSYLTCRADYSPRQCSHLATP